MATNVFLKDLNFLVEAENISFFDFINKVMSIIYQLIFNNEFPRVSEDMKNKLKLSSKPTGDWFLFRDHTIIRVYGFSGAPYILPTFLTPSIFALEFIRKILHSENEHFVDYNKAYNIKFHYNIGPFVIKTRSTFPIIEKFLKFMKFKEAKRVNFSNDGST
jgi:hypothetical protein